MFHMVDWFSLYISYIVRISLALGRSLLVNYDRRRACRATLSCICIESGVDIESKQTFQKLEKSETRFRVVQVKYKTSRFQYRRPLTAHRERSSETSANFRGSMQYNTLWWTDIEIQIRGIQEGPSQASDSSSVTFIPRYAPASIAIHIPQHR